MNENVARKIGVIGEGASRHNLYLANAFSLQMLQGDADISVRHLTKEQASLIVLSRGWESCVGHADTASVFTEQLGVDVPMNRIDLKVKSGDKILVGQLTGGRLPEGTLTLPNGFSIKWMMVTVR